MTNLKAKKIKILFVFGTRPEAIKMASLIKECERNKNKYDPCVCVTAQHREMLDQVLELFDIKPHHDLNIMTERQSLSDLLSRIIIGVSEVMVKERPELVVVQGDTITTFAAAQASYFLKIPVAHIEAGLRTHKKYSPFPEEVNRRLTGVITDFHFAPTENAKDNLVRENFPESSIFITGNTVIDVLKWMQTRFEETAVRQRWHRWFLSNYNIAFSLNVKTILVTGHRRENFGQELKNICHALRILARDNPDIQIIFPVHLNPHVQEPVNAILRGIDNIHLLPPLDYEPFIFLMNQSYLILTDSGGIQEEAPALGIPVLVLRVASERPEGIKAEASKLIGTSTEAIVNETQLLLKDEKRYRRMANVLDVYGDGKASKKILSIISERLEV